MAFNRICIPPLKDGRKRYDIGQLAESLIFYDEVVILMQPNSVKGFFRECDPETLFALHSDGYVRIAYLNHLYGTIRRNKDTLLAQFDNGLISSDKLNLDKASREALVEVSGKRGKGRRMASHFTDIADVVSYPENATEEIRKELKSGRYIEEYISEILDSAGVELEGGDPVFRFDKKLDRGYTVTTNIDFDEMQERGISELSKPESVLTKYGTAAANLALWSDLDAEAAVHPEESRVLSSRVSAMLQQRFDADHQISTFQDFTLNDSRAIRKAINSGEKDLGNLLPVLKKSRKFKDWVQDADDEELVKEYFREVTSDTWIDRLPAKSSRWLLFTGAGVLADAVGTGGLGTATGVTLSAFDNLLLDRILEGWKPNQFVEEELSEFVAEK